MLHGRPTDEEWLDDDDDFDANDDDADDDAGMDKCIASHFSIRGSLNDTYILYVNFTLQLIWMDTKVSVYLQRLHRPFRSYFEVQKSALVVFNLV